MHTFPFLFLLFDCNWLIDESLAGKFEIDNIAFCNGDAGSILDLVHLL